MSTEWASCTFKNIATYYLLYWFKLKYLGECEMFKLYLLYISEFNLAEQHSKRFFPSLKGPSRYILCFNLIQLLQFMLLVDLCILF